MYGLYERNTQASSTNEEPLLYRVQGKHRVPFQLHVIVLYSCHCPFVVVYNREHNNRFVLFHIHTQSKPTHHEW